MGLAGAGVIAGNLLADEPFPGDGGGYQAATGGFGDRLLAGLQAGLAAGGEAGPVHSAGLLIVEGESWPVADLRCDWSDEARPVEAVARAWSVYAPQMAAYVQRARDPRAAPAYGVAGES